MKIAVFGGVFDPVHNGHIECARLADRALCPDKLIFVPSGRPPHKVKMMNTAHHRTEMLKIAVSENFGERAEICNFETDSDGFSYTSDTLAHLRCVYGMEAEIYFVVGSDNIGNIEGWHKPEVIRTLATIAVVKRPGYDSAAAKKLLPECIVLEGESVEDASSDIRNAAARGEDFSSLVPRGVYDYIKKHGLYPKTMGEDEILNFVKERLTPSRFSHTVGVRDAAEVLAARFNADCRSARIAAFLHDCTKNLSLNEMLKLCEKYDIITDELQRRQEALLHGITAEAVAFFEVGICDGDILEAIRYHTTGRRGMPNLMKIIYLADCIEPSRNYPGVDELRELSLVNLDKACLASIDKTIKFLISKRAEVHADTLAARNSLIRGVEND